MDENIITIRAIIISIAHPLLMENNQLSKQKRIVFSLLTIAISTSLAFLAAEILVRAFSPDWLDMRMKELQPGKEYRIGSDQDWPTIKVGGKFKSFSPGSKLNINHYEYSNTAFIDEHGGRSASYRKNNNIIPILGDSFTFGIGVEDHQTYISILGNNTDFRFLNLGVPGSALHIHNDMIRMRHIELGRPRLYIFSIFTGNDLEDIAKYHSKLASKNRGKNNITNSYLFLHSINNFVYHNRLLKKSFLIQFLRHQILNYLNRNNDYNMMDPIFKYSLKGKLLLPESMEYFKKEVERLETISNDLDFGFVFIVIPDRHQVNGELRGQKTEYYNLNEEDLDMYAVNKMLVNYFTSKNIRFYDTTPCLRGHPSIEKLYYIQDNHLTSMGHTALSECLEKSSLLDHFTE